VGGFQQIYKKAQTINWVIILFRYLCYFFRIKFRAIWRLGNMSSKLCVCVCVRVCVCACVCAYRYISYNYGQIIILSLCYTSLQQDSYLTAFSSPISHWMLLKLTVPPKRSVVLSVQLHAIENSLKSGCGTCDSVPPIGGWRFAIEIGAMPTF